MSDTQILLLGAAFDSSNNGVNALSIGALSALSAHYHGAVEIMIANLDAGPGSMSSVVINGRKICTRKVELARNSLIKSALVSYAVRPLPYSVREWVVLRDPVLRAYYQAVYVVSLSEGDSFAETYGLRRLLKHSFYQLPAIALGKPLILFPQTIGPFYSRLGKFIARYILNRARVVMSREPSSTEIARDMMRNPNRLVERSDMAFLMEPTPVDVPLFRRIHKFVGINVSGLLYYGAGGQKLPWAVDKYRSFVHQLVSQFVRKEGIPVILIPHVNSPASKTDDLRACQETWVSLDTDVQESVHILEDSLSAQELKYLIGQADFFVGSRMHACIAAISMGVAAAAVSYSHKFQGVFAQLGLEELVHEPSEYSVDDMLQRIHESYIARGQISELLRTTIPSARQRAAESATYLEAS